MRFVAATFALLAAQLSHAQTGNLEFKGLRFTENPQQVGTTLGVKLECSDKPHQGLTSCHSDPLSTYAEEPTKGLFSYDFIDDRLAGVTVQLLSVYSADRVEQVIAQKYGKPSNKGTRTAKHWTDGRPYQINETKWNVRGGQILLSLNSPPVNMLLVTFTSDEKAAWYRKVERPKPTAKKDL